MSAASNQTSSSAGVLTNDQKQRMEANKAKALAKLAEKKKQQNATSSAQPAGNPPTKQASKSTLFYPAASSAKSSSKDWQSQSTPSRKSSESAADKKHRAISSHSVKKTAVKLVLLNKKRFEVVAGFDVSLVALLKTFPKRSFDQVKKTWSFDVLDCLKITKELNSNGFDVDEIPRSVISILCDEKGMPPSDITNKTHRVESSIMQALMPFQLDGLNFGIAKEGKLIIADDMGLGKTIQAIAIACYYRNEWPVLVICPSSLRMTWKQAFLNWIPTLSVDDVNVVLSSKDDVVAGTVIVTSYDLLLRNIKEVTEKGFNVIIVDESHFLKNFKAARTKATLPLLQKAKRAILLSGTPALSRPEELFTQILAVNSRLFPSFIPFAKRYCCATKNAFGWDTSGSSNLEELKIILEKHVMIRRMKQDVIAQLPEKSRQLITLDPSLINLS